MTDKDYKELRKNLKKDYSKFPVIRVAILSDVSAQYPAQALRALAYEYRLNIEIYEGAFDQIESETIDLDSGLYKFDPEYILILSASENLCRSFYRTPAIDREVFASSRISRLFSACERIEKNSRAEVLLCNFTELDDGVYGNLAAVHRSALLSTIREINSILANESRERGRVHLVDICMAGSELGRACAYDPRMFYLSSNPFSQDFLVNIAERILAVIRTLRGSVKKCLITDLDGTLWGGIIGDIGLDNISIGELGLGRAFSDYQAWLLELSRRGIAICVCSKNDENTAKEPFISHPDMMLSLDDIAVFKANWESKDSNIREIQRTLNIGLDSMIFIDDNPAERDLIKNILPGVTVPEIPEDPVFRLPYLQSLGLFETVGISEEDSKRTEMYKVEGARSSAKEQAGSIEEYFKSLNMRCTIKPFDAFSVPRIAQLAQRTNQFNLRTRRYSEVDITSIAESDEFITMCVSLSDNFGDYGIIGAVILKHVPEDGIFIDTFLMSCRVAKRGVEEFIFNRIAGEAEVRGIKHIIGEYIPTAKNGPVSGLLADMGFSKIQRAAGGIPEEVTSADKAGVYTGVSAAYKLNIGEYSVKETFVKEE